MYVKGVKRKIKTGLCIIGGLVKKPSKKGLTRKLDKLCSEIVRSKGYCEKCKLTETLQCCHIFSRKNRSVRWDLINLLSLCAKCHFWSHQNPVLFTEWVREHLGEYEYSVLKRRAGESKKWTIEEMQAWYVLLLQFKSNQWER
jgi:hypothetical protein